MDRPLIENPGCGCKIQLHYPEELVDTRINGWYEIRYCKLHMAASRMKKLLESIRDYYFDTHEISNEQWLKITQEVGDVQEQDNA